MAKLHAGGISLGTGFKIVDPTPIDDRLVVATTDDLIDASSLPNIYEGILVSVTTSDKVYRWNGTDRTQLTNWEQLAKITDATSTTGLAVLDNNNTFEGENTFNNDIDVDGNISATGDISANTFSFTNTSFEDVVISNTEATNLTANSIELITNITPSTNSNGTNGSTIGSSTKKFREIYAVNTFFGGIHEINLKTKGLDKMQEGTVLTLRNGMMCPCENEADPLVMGVVSKGENFPIVLGAEPVLITGKIEEGDFIITSNIKGHGKGINPRHIYDQQLFGKIIAQAIENGEGESYTIKAMIRKM